jgi:hypothetical protein
MSVPNIGPELPDRSERHAQDHARRGNPSLVYRDDLPAGDVAAAGTRASAVTQRFGGVRYALSRPGLPEAGDSGPPFDFRLGWPWQARLDLPTETSEGGEPDPHD